MVSTEEIWNQEGHALSAEGTSMALRELVIARMQTQLEAAEEQNEMGLFELRSQAQEINKKVQRQLRNKNENRLEVSDESIKSASVKTGDDEEVNASQPKTVYGTIDYIKKKRSQVAHKTEETKKKATIIQIEETSKTAQYRDLLNQQQNELNERIEQEAFDIRKLTLDTNNYFEEALIEQKREDHEKIKIEQYKLKSLQKEERTRLCDVQVAQMTSDNVKEVDTRIMNVKNSVLLVQECSNGVSTVFGYKFDEKTKRSALTRLELLDKKLTSLIQDLISIETNSGKIANSEARKKLTDQILCIKKNIINARRDTSKVVQGLKCCSEFDKKNCERFGSSIATIVKEVNDIEQLKSEEDSILLAISAGSAVGRSEIGVANRHQLEDTASLS